MFILPGSVCQCQPAVLHGSTGHWAPTSYHLAGEGSVCVVASNAATPAAPLPRPVAGQACWWPLPPAVSTRWKGSGVVLGSVSWQEWY